MTAPLQPHQIIAAQTSVFAMLKLVQIQSKPGVEDGQETPGFLRRFAHSSEFYSKVSPFLEKVAIVFEHLEEVDLDDQEAFDNVSQEFVDAAAPLTSHFLGLFTGDPSAARSATESFREAQENRVSRFLDEPSAIEAFQKTFSNFYALGDLSAAHLGEEGERETEAALEALEADPGVRNTFSKHPIMHVHLLLMGTVWLAMEGRSQEKAIDMSHMAYLKMSLWLDLMEHAGLAISAPGDDVDDDVDALLEHVERLRQVLSDEDLEGILEHHSDPLR